MARNVVVLGAGIGGLSTARELQRHLTAEDQITLVDSSPIHVQGLSLLWLLRGWRTLDDVTVDPIPPALGRVRGLTAAVTELDLARRRVHTSTGPIGYDALVVALGAQLHPGAVPGLEDAIAAGSAVHYYSPQAAIAAHATLRTFTSGRVVFLVTSTPYKCPAAPYEGALLTADLLTDLGNRHQTTIDLYTPEPQPMPVAGPVVGAGVVSMLESAGVEFHPDYQVDHIDGTTRDIVFTDGTRETFDLLVAIPPHRSPAPVTDAGFSPQGWIPVDPHTLTSSTEGVWALGDVTSITLPNGKPLPKAAVFAKAQAIVVAAGVARYLGYDAPEQRFTGEGYCYLELGAGLAAKGAGNFYHPHGPRITMSNPSHQLHRDKEAEETGWLATWNPGNR